jgi:vacuolar-type H+-ATPase subunit F/Vma7
MTRGVRIVCGPDVSPGLALAGLAAVPADDPVAAALRITRLLDEPDVGVILVDERLYEALPDELRSRFARNPLPLVVPFPGPVWVSRREGAEAYVAELLRRAIGYRVRLR